MALEVRIKKSFPDFKLDVEFRTGEEVFGVLGESGCGKSLTLKCKMCIRDSGGTGNADSSKPGAGSDSQAAGTVKTGDSANLILWAALLGVSLAGYTLVVRRKKTDR